VPVLLKRARPLDLRTGLLRDPVDLLTGGGRISAPPATVQAEVIDLEGRAVIPGLWDEHVHVGQLALARRRFEVSQTASVEGILADVAVHLAELPTPGAGLIVQGFGFRASQWDRLPSSADLDRVVGEVPVALVSADLHSVWCSTRAARELGFGGDGFLTEADSFEAQTRLASMSPEALDLAVSACGQEAAARGVVGIRDMEFDSDIETWLRREATGCCHHRVEVAVYPDRLDEAVARGLATGRAAAPGSLVAMGPLKVIVDGSMSTHSAWCHEPYPGGDGPDGAGVDTVGPRDLESLLARARDADLLSAVHAIGDRAATTVLDAFEITGERGSLEHAQLLRRSDLPRFAALGVTASVQPLHLVDDRDAADVVWADRTGRTFLFADLLASGARLAFGSDAPVSPVDPWAAVRVAVERTGDRRPPWHPEQAIGLSEALLASTRGIAVTAPGGPADLVALDVDPFALGGEDLAGVTSALTMAGGRVTHTLL
jgi:predicted amidohydrolase YtcJ